MKTIFAAAAAVSALAMATAPAAAETRAERSEARLAKMLEGRVAGEAESCITTFRSNDLRVMEHVGLVYEQGDTIWVGRASNPRQLGSSDVPVIERMGSQLCRTDIINTVDRYSGFYTGSVFIDGFVPYTKSENG